MTTTKTETAIVAVPQVDYSESRMETARQAIAPNIRPQVWAYFLSVCQARGLDPVTRQVHLTPDGTVIVGIDGFRVIAERTGEYRPGETAYRGEGKEMHAAVTVWRWVRGDWWPITETAYLAEYYREPGQRGPGPWQKMPRVMLAKCAEARALRRAFPAALGGLHTPDEMPPEKVNAEVVEGESEPTKKEAPKAKAAAKKKEAPKELAHLLEHCRALVENVSSPLAFRRLVEQQEALTASWSPKMRGALASWLKYVDGVDGALSKSTASKPLVEPQEAKAIEWVHAELSKLADPPKLLPVADCVAVKGGGA